MMDIMKLSGIEWIGEMPIKWDVKRLKLVAKICNGSEYADIEIDEGGYPVMGSGGKFARASKFCYDKPSLLLGRKGTVDKPLFVSEPFWCVDTMFYTIAKENTDVKYLYYTALNFDFEFYQTSTALPSMTQRDLGSIVIPIPNLPEQQSIATFLDKSCSQIDTIISDLELQVEILQKYKKALITETVTKGLDKSAPMKDSGIEWIGEMPEHWEIKRLKFLGTARNGLTYSPDDVVDEENGTLVLRSSNIQNGELTFNDNVYVTTKIPHEIVLQENDLLICSRNGSRDLIGKCSLIDERVVGKASQKILCKRIFPTDKNLTNKLASDTKQLEPCPC